MNIVICFWDGSLDQRRNSGKKTEVMQIMDTEESGNRWARKWELYMWTSYLLLCIKLPQNLIAENSQHPWPHTTSVTHIRLIQWERELSVEMQGSENHWRPCWQLATLCVHFLIFRNREFINSVQRWSRRLHYNYSKFKIVFK